MGFSWTLEPREKRSTPFTLSARNFLVSEMNEYEKSRPVGEHRPVAVLYCDLVGSTQLTQTDNGEPWALAIREFLSICTDVAKSFGQSIDQAAGDGIGIWFGRQNVTEDDAIMATLAALDLKRRIGEIVVPGLPTINCRIGIASGHVANLYSSGGEPGFIVGNVLNLAARIQESAGSNEIFLDTETSRILGKSGMVASQGVHKLKGFNDPIELWKLIQILPGTSRFDTRNPTKQANIEGRTDEFKHLSKLWKHLDNSEASVVCIEGDPGIGKSRLIKEFLQEMQKEGDFLYLGYQCEPRKVNVPMYPIESEIIASSNIISSDNNRTKKLKIDRMLDSQGIDSSDAREAFLNYIDLEHQTQVFSAEKTFIHFQKQFTSSILQIAKRSLVVMVIEDLHWVDPSTVSLLTNLIDLIKSLPVIIIMSYRGRDIIENESAHSLCKSVEKGDLPVLTKMIELEPLTVDASRRLVLQLLRGRSTVQEAIDLILEKSDGVPLHIEEVTNILLQSGKYDQALVNGNLESLNFIAETTNPLPRYLEARFASLGEAKYVAHIGACIGRRFQPDMIAKVMRRQPELMAPVFRRLIESEIVYVRNENQGDILEFKHALLQDIASIRLFAEDLKNTNRRIAEVYEEFYPDVCVADPVLLANHLEICEEYFLASQYIFKAVRQAKRRSALTEALAHISKANSLLEGLPDEVDIDSLRVDFQIEYSSILFARYGGSNQQLEVSCYRSIELATKHSLQDRLFKAHLELTNYFYVRGELNKASIHIQECLKYEAQQNSDISIESENGSCVSDNIIHINRIAGELQFYLGDIRDSTQKLETCIRHYEQKAQTIRDIEISGSKDACIKWQQGLLDCLGDESGILAMMYLSIGKWFQGDTKDSKILSLRGLELAQKLNHHYTLAQATFNAAWLSALSMNVLGAHRYAEDAIRYCSQAKDDSFEMYLGLSQVLLGWAEVRANQDTSGIILMHKGMERVRLTDADICLSCFLPWLAEVYLLTGDLDKGIECIEEAFTTAQEAFYQAERLRIKAQLYAHSNKEHALKMLKESIDISKSRGNKSLELRSTLAAIDLNIDSKNIIVSLTTDKCIWDWILSAEPSREIALARSLIKSTIT
jgi:class 3 adenylate cyclase/tetratricopeptide (TPR) repeat protein